MAGDTHAVLYTDGGCKPSRGFGGWGIHGYVYDDKEAKVGTGLKDWLITAYGYQQYNNDSDLDPLKVNVTSYIDVIGNVVKQTTNNLMEMDAAKNALLLAKENEFKSLLIITDSKYVLDGLTKWVEKWVINDWVKPDGQIVTNKDEWMELYELYLEVKKSGIDVDLAIVKGHSNDQGNDAADHHASLGVLAAKKHKLVKKVYVNNPKGYWKSKPLSNRMFTHNNWYFNTINACPMSSDNKHIYYIGDHGKDDDFIGKRLADASMAILFLNKPEAVLESIREVQKEIDVDKLNTVVIGKLPNIFKSKIYKNISDNGGIFLERKNHKLDIYDVDRVQLTEEKDPPLLTHDLINSLNMLESIYNGARLGGDVSVVSTDITHLLYETTTKGKVEVHKLLSQITPASKSLPFDVKHGLDINKGNAHLTLTLGMDLPNRNDLSAMAEKNPKVSVITWKESKRAIRYATIIDTDDGSGIWAAFYSNTCILT